MKSLITISEQQISRQVCELLRLKGIMFFHVPNEGRRSYWERKQFIDNGGMAGAPDLVLVLPAGRVAFIELKSDKGKLSDNQEEFYKKTLSLDHDYYVWHSVKDCADWIKDNQK